MSGGLKFSLYGKTFQEGILRIAEAQGFEVFDLDIVSDDLSPLGANEVVLLMAVVEHLNGSPRRLMEAIHQMIADRGFLIFEVPNIAAFARRIALLLGRSPLPDYESYLGSEYPFAGHNREMTVPEVRYLLEHTGYHIERIQCYDYASERPGSFRQRVHQFLKDIAPFRHKGASIMALARSQRVAA